PDGPDTEYVPELAHMSIEEQKALWNVIGVEDDEPDGGDNKSDNPLRGRPRSRTYWPGQHVRCGICGGLMYRYGAKLRCQNNVPKGPKTCWNRVHVDISVVQKNVLGWVLSMLDQWPGVRAAIIEFARDEFARVRQRNHRLSDEVAIRIESLEAAAKNLAKAI